MRDELRLQVLGPVTAAVGGRPLRLGPARQAAMLAVLVCRLNAPVPADALVEAVWGDEPPATGAKVVPTYAYRLRQVFAAVPGAPVLEYGRDGYTLRFDPERLDLACFTRLVRTGLARRSAGRAGEARAGLRAAEALWGGDPFGSLPGPLLAGERARLAELRLSALAVRLELDLTAGDPAGLLGELWSVHLRHPLHERFACLLMTALCRGGRQADALAVYARTAARLDAELGVRPGPELREHHRAVLAGDPRLLDRATAPCQHCGAAS